MLVTDTAAVPSLFVVAADGHDVLAPQTATFGRWLSDIEILIQQDPQDSAAPRTNERLYSTEGITAGTPYVELLADVSAGRSIELVTSGTRRKAE